MPVLAVGVTGHSRTHPSFPGDPAGLTRALEDTFAMIERIGTQTAIHGMDDAPVHFRLVTLLADGTDQIAAEAALERQWELCAPIPFGEDLNAAINAAPHSAADAAAILAHETPQDAHTAQRAATTRDLVKRAHVLELAERDAEIERAFLSALADREDPVAQAAFLHHTSHRAQLAGQILIEQCDLLIAVWDGASAIAQGGTGHTAKLALQAGVPVLRIDPSDPAKAQLIRLPEELEGVDESLDESALEPAIRAAIESAIGLGAPTVAGQNEGLKAVSQEAWRPASSKLNHAFRRLEAVFGEASWARKFRSIRQTYERPDQVEDGQNAALLAAIEGIGEEGRALRQAVTEAALPGFAWTDGIASQMADRYRSGMVINFTLGALAIISGVLYLPLVDTSQKWIFASIELGLLLMIVINTISGQRMRLHHRWLETRRAAEYGRHSALLYVFGVARPLGRWPAALRSQWPEWYARMALRDMGLAKARIDSVYLRAAAQTLRDHFVQPQIDYHLSKSERLHRAHHAIEGVAERLFGVAILVVATFLTLSALAAFGLVEAKLVKGVAKWFTVIAIALPTISGALAAIGFFGDFDRFADISQGTAQRLSALRDRIDAFLALSDEALGYEQFADLARGADAVVFDEIQAWQSVFSGKRITVPA